MEIFEDIRVNLNPKKIGLRDLLPHKYQLLQLSIMSSKTLRGEEGSL